MIKQGDMIEVSDSIDFEDFEIREFIDMTNEGKYLCWSENKINALSWRYGKEIDLFKELKECAKFGAIIELYDEDIENWIEIKPSWIRDIKYRIKGGIAPEQFKKHPKEIMAWWNGAEIEYFNPDDNNWCNTNGKPLWNVHVKYRIKEPKIVYEWLYKPGDTWLLSAKILTEEEAFNNFKSWKYMKTGRSWEVPDDNS
jgi:hypothetical protein